MENETTIQEVEIIKAKSAADFALTPAGQMVKTFEVQQRMAQMYATSTIVPQMYQKNIGNCVIALDMATRMQANPIMVMQNLYIVHGMPGWSSKFLIATINNCGRFSPLRYEFKGTEGKDDWGCRCYAYEVKDTEHKDPLYGDWVTIKMAKAEGWSTKPGSKWLTMPGQMLRYRAAAFWQRIYAPEISMGFSSTEEVEEIQDIPYEEVKQQKANAEAVYTQNANTGAEIDADTGEVKENQEPVPEHSPEQQQQQSDNEPAGTQHATGSLFDGPGF